MNAQRNRLRGSLRSRKPVGRDDLVNNEQVLAWAPQDLGETRWRECKGEESYRAGQPESHRKDQSRRIGGNPVNFKYSTPMREISDEQAFEVEFVGLRL